MFLIIINVTDATAMCKVGITGYGLLSTIKL